MKIVVVGATGVGKTTFIDLMKRRRTAQNGEPKFVEISWPRKASDKNKKFSKKRVCLGIIIVEPNRYSMLFLERIYLAFSPEIPKIVVLNKIDMLISPFIDRSEEVKTVENFCKKYSCQLFKTDISSFNSIY